MAGSPAANRTQVVWVGQLDDVSGADSVVNETADVLATPFIVRRIFGQVVTGVTVASVTTTLNWRPNPGAATDEKLIATFEIPVAAADTQFVVDLNVNTVAETVFGAGGPTSEFGLSGHSVQGAGDSADLICGPGGELEFDAPGGEASAGAVELWIEVELLSFGNDQQVGLVHVVPDVVGS